MTAVFQPPPTHAEVIIQGGAGKWVFNPVWSKWFIDLTHLINNSGGGGGTINHNSLAGLQGGGTGEYYHLTAAEHTFIAASSDSTKFLRGDKTWSAALTGPFQATNVTATGDLSVQGNTTLGDASGDTITLTGRLASNVQWGTDNAFDLGATGANRPRDVFLGRNLSVGANASPSANDGAALGTTALKWSDLFLASGAVINFNNGNVLISHAANTLIIAAGTLISTIFAGTSTASLDVTSSASDSTFTVTAGGGVGQINIASFTDAAISFSDGIGTYSLGLDHSASNSFVLSRSSVLGTSNVLSITTTGAATFSGTWADLGPVTTVDINGGTVDGVVIGGASAAAGTFTNLTSTGNTTIGDAAGDTLTLNADTWTLNNNFIETRAAGTVAAGAVNFRQYVTTLVGDSGGTTSARAYMSTITASGANNLSNVIVLDSVSVHAGSGTVTNLSCNRAALSYTSTGGSTNAQCFDASSLTLSSSGVPTTVRGYVARNLGNASVTNVLGYDALDQTAGATLTAGFRGQVTSGTGKWNAYMSGTANNAFAGSVRVGSTVAPTVPLDVTGDINGSTNFTAWTSFTTTRTGWTDVGSPTVTGRYCQVRNIVFFQVKVVPGTTVATVAGTSYISLPVTAGGSAIGGDGSMENATTLVGVGNVVMDTANSRCYVPTQGATGNTLTISGWYEV